MLWFEKKDIWFFIYHLPNCTSKPAHCTVGACAPCSALLPGRSAPPAVGCRFLSSEMCTPRSESDRSRHAGTWPVATDRRVRPPLWPRKSAQWRKSTEFRGTNKLSHTSSATQKKVLWLWI